MCLYVTIYVSMNLNAEKQIHDVTVVPAWKFGAGDLKIKYNNYATHWTIFKMINNSNTLKKKKTMENLDNYTQQKNKHDI